MSSDNVRQQPPLGGDIFRGIPRNRNSKTLEFSMFSRWLRFRPGEPVKSIIYKYLLLIYYAILAYAIEPPFAISNLELGTWFDFASRHRKVAGVCT